MKQIFTFLAILSCASAFAPVSQQAAFGIKSTALNMAAPEIKKGVVAAAAGFMPAILSSTAAVATEGTNEWFGVDDPRLLGVLFIGHLFVLTLWLGSYGDASEDDDFFGEIDYTGN